MDFWEFFWNVVVAFFFVAYLILLFQIFADLLRDRDLGGFAKAVWIFFLLIAPFISALIYVIVRGNGMAERAQSRAQAASEQTDDYVRRVAGSSSPTQQIESARALLSEGYINQSEYDRLKSMALSA